MSSIGKTGRLLAVDLLDINWWRPLTLELERRSCAPKVAVYSKT
jgi:hypothetical protein